MKSLKTPLLAFAVLANVATSTTGLVAAKGGGSAGSASVPTTLGACDLVTTDALNTSVYPLTNDNFPGSVAVTINLNGTAPLAQSICLDAGWSVQYKTVTDGFQANFTYNGERAIDMKYVLGKTDIRNY